MDRFNPAVLTGQKPPTRLVTINKEREVPLCAKKYGHKEALLEVIKDFFDRNAKLKDEGDNESEEYVVQYTSEKDLTAQEEIQLQQLCRLKVDEFKFNENLAPEESHDDLVSRPKVPTGISKISAESSHQKIPKTRPTAHERHPRKERPDNLRVQRIPLDYDKSKLEEVFMHLFDARADVHSLCRESTTSQCATVTFPEEPNSFLQECIEKMKYEKFKPQMHLDGDFFGITPLFEATVNDNTPVVDIIAVVGLGTNAFGTFRAPEGDGMWLRDFLPEDVKGIRVLIYGYQSPVDKSKCIDTIDSLASSCLDKIIAFRGETETENNPIVFLGQSLGGLIVQRMMCDADRDKKRRPELRQILHHWHGLIGFGIPRTGLDNERLKTRVIDQPNEKLISQMVLDENGKGPEYLQTLAEKFGSTTGCCFSADPEIIYFRENQLTEPRVPSGQKSSDPVLMVKYDYERLPQDYKSDKIRCAWLHADHSGMVKYANNADQNYISVKYEIKKMVQSAKEAEW